jgi:hypothetical protein
LRAETDLNPTKQNKDLNIMQDSSDSKKDFLCSFFLHFQKTVEAENKEKFFIYLL